MVGVWRIEASNDISACICRGKQGGLWKIFKLQRRAGEPPMGLWGDTFDSICSDEYGVIRDNEEVSTVWVKDHSLRRTYLPHVGGHTSTGLCVVSYDYNEMMGWNADARDGSILIVIG